MQVSIRQADLCCFEATPRRARLAPLGSFNPPSGFVLFRSVTAITLPTRRTNGFNPPSGFVLFRSLPVHKLTASRIRFNPPSGFVLFRSKLILVSSSERMFQSAKRICAVSKQVPRGPVRSGGDVSIRQADLCCFEAQLQATSKLFAKSFNPPSGFVLFRSRDLASYLARAVGVSIRQADLCCFEGWSPPA